MHLLTTAGLHPCRRHGSLPLARCCRLGGLTSRNPQLSRHCPAACCSARRRCRQFSSSCTMLPERPAILLCTAGQSERVRRRRRLRVRPVRVPANRTRADRLAVVSVCLLQLSHWARSLCSVGARRIGYDLGLAAIRQSAGKRLPVDSTAQPTPRPHSQQPRLIPRTPLPLSIRHV